MLKICLSGLVALVCVACSDSGSGRNEARTLTALKAHNQSLEMYQPLHEGFVPEMGTHYGVAGPHLTVVVADEDLISAFELIVPEEAGWQPWFDQAEGEPTTIEGFGSAYTQHVYVTARSSVVEGQRPILLNLDLDTLTQANPALEQYVPLSEYVPGMGIHYGAAGPAVILVTAENGAINAFELVSPVEQGWFAWFDQPEGQPTTIEGVGEAYTQHLYIIDPASID